jgi:hypothetical protein
MSQPPRVEWLVGFVVLLALTGVVGSAGKCLAQEKSIREATEAIGPYCGIYCLYAALDALGRDVSLEELISSNT